MSHLLLLDEVYRTTVSVSLVVIVAFVVATIDRLVDGHHRLAVAKTQTRLRLIRDDDRLYVCPLRLLDATLGYHKRLLLAAHCPH